MQRKLLLFGVAFGLTAAAPMPQDEFAIAGFATRAVTQLCPMLLDGRLDLKNAEQAESHGFATDKLGERSAYSIGEAPDRVLIARGLLNQECTIAMNAARHPQAFEIFKQNLVQAGFLLTLDKPSAVGGSWRYFRTGDQDNASYRVAILRFDDQSVITATKMTPKEKK